MTYHQTLGYVSFDVYHSTKANNHLHTQTVTGSWLFDQPNPPYCRVHTLNIIVVLEADWNTVQWPNRPSFPLKILIQFLRSRKRPLEEDFGQTTRELLRYSCTFAVRISDSMSG